MNIKLHYKMYKTLLTSALVLFLTVTLISNKTNAQAVVLPGFTDELVSNGWTEVEGFVFDSIGRMFVWEKAGKVWIVDTNGIKQATPLIDISPEVGNWRDHGLNGFALDPNFLTNGYIYLFYNVDRHFLIYDGTPFYNAATNDYYKATIVRITRYQADVATNCTSLVPNSRFILLGESPSTGIPCLHESHTGGSLVFARDGSLIASSGDGASYNATDVGNDNGTYYQQGLSSGIITPAQNVGALRSQMVNSFNGKLFRLDPMTGDGLPTNPFYEASNPRSAKSRMWASGLRNPFRVNIRPNTGETDITAGEPGKIYIGDVQWSTWEELSVCDEGGQNFGWPLFEGLTPMTTYMAANTKNLDAPNPLYGIGGCTKDYFMFKDLCKQETQNTTNLFMNPCNLAVPIPASIPTFMHKRPVCDWSHGSVIARVPTFDIGGNATTYTLGSGGVPPVAGPSFQGNCSAAGCWYTSDKYPYQYQNTYFSIDFGGQWIKNFIFDSLDNLLEVKPFASNVGAIVYLATNPRTGTLNYVNYGGEIRRIRYTLGVDNPPIAVATADTIYGASPLTVQFTGHNSHDPENTTLSYNWDFGDGNTSTLADPSNVFVDASNNPHTYTVTLTVTDAGGNSVVATLKIYLNNTPPVVSITSILDSSLYSVDYQSFLPLNATVTDAEHGPNQLFYSWVTYLYHNNHNHPEATDTNKVSTTTISPTSCDEIFHYKIKLTVTDADGLSGSDEVDIYPACSSPVSQFDGTPTSFCAGADVQFADHSLNIPTTYEWYFEGGNPQTSVAQNPIVNYASAGTFDVRLITTSSRGSDTLLFNDYITVYPFPIINLGLDTSYCGNQLLDAGNSGSQYLWSDNSTDQTLPVATSGTYSVLVTNAGGCTSTDAVSMVVNAAAQTSLGSDTTLCSASFTINAEAGFTSYLWNDGSTTQSLDATNSGTYTIIVSDVNGCTATDDVNVTVNHVPFIDLGNDTSSCNTPINVIATQGFAKYLWNDGSTDDHITANITGIYSVLITDANNCTSSDDINVAINALPAIELGNDTASCNIAITLDAGANGTIYLWNDGSTTQTYTATSTGNYVVTITDNNGCSASDNITATINQLPVVDLGNDTASCNTPIVITATSGFLNYLWNDGSTDDQLTATLSGVYSVIITDANNCTSSDQINVAVNALPVIPLSTDTSSCNTTIILDAGIDGTNYLWNDGSSNQTFDAIVSGNYTVTVTDVNSCESSQSITVTINPLPVVELGNDTAICGLSITLDAGLNGTDYLWSDGNTTQLNTITSTGNYTVTITDANGCSANDHVLATINQVPVMSLGNDASTCAMPASINAPGGFVSYLWNDGSISQNKNAIFSGTYTVTVTDNKGCTTSDDIIVHINPLPVVALGNDTTVCGASIILDAGANATQYLWSNGAVTQTMLPVTSGTYTVTTTDANSCTGTDQIHVTINPLPVINLGNNISTCNLPATLNAPPNFAAYLWSDGNTSQSITVSTSGIYSVTVTNANNCTASDNITVSINALPQVQFNAFTTDSICSATPIFSINVGTPSGGIYSGSGVLGNTFFPSAAGLGWIIVTYNYTDNNGCTNNAQDSVFIDGCTAIAQLYSKVDLKVFPNPTSGELNISYSFKQNEKIKLTVFDLEGKELKSIMLDASKTKIDLTGLDDGIYSLKFFSGVDVISIQRIVKM